MAEKMTKRDMFGAAVGILIDAGAEQDIIDGLLHEVDLLDKKHNAGPNPKRVAEVRAAKDTILAAMGDNAMRASALAGATGFTVQRVTALLTQMVKDDEVVREQDGKVTTFKVAA